MTIFESGQKFSIPGIKLSKVEFGDFNGDGYSDIKYSGVQSGSGKISELRQYDNNILC